MAFSRRDIKWTLSELKEYLTRVDYPQRTEAEDKVRRITEKKAKAFAVQYAKAKAQAERK